MIHSFRAGDRKPEVELWQGWLPLEVLRWIRQRAGQLGVICQAQKQVESPPRCVQRAVGESCLGQSDLTSEGGHKRWQPLACGHFLALAVTVYARRVYFLFRELLFFFHFFFFYL